MKCLLSNKARSEQAPARFKNKSEEFEVVLLTEYTQLVNEMKTSKSTFSLNLCASGRISYLFSGVQRIKMMVNREREPKVCVQSRAIYYKCIAK